MKKHTMKKLLVSWNSNWRRYKRLTDHKLIVSLA